MDLSDTPDSMPVASSTLIVKPENQGNITKSNGSRSVRFHLPDYLGYFLPSQSNFHFELEMKGRGFPIPSHDCGAHALFLNIRTRDGTGSHLLEAVEQYNTLVSQMYAYTKSESSENNRAEFEGVQASDAIDGNLYWALAGGNNWVEGDGIENPPLARPVQIVSPIRTKLYNSDKFIPIEAMGGLRLEIQLENYLRALEWTAGSLAAEANNALPCFPLALAYNSEGFIPADGAQTQQDFFTVNTAGSGYVANNIYTMKQSGGSTILGYVKVKGVNGSGAFKSGEIWVLGTSAATSSLTVPSTGMVLELGDPGGGGAVATITVNTGYNGSGTGAVANKYQNVEIPLWTSSGANLAVAAVANSSTGAVATGTDVFGTDTLRDPDRRVTPKAPANYDPKGCYPNTIMPLSVGDRIYISHSDGTDEVAVGCLAGIKVYAPVAGATNNPTLVIRPDKPIVAAAGLGNNVAAPSLTNNHIWTDIYAYTHKKDGLKLYFKNADRINGWAPAANADWDDTVLVHAAGVSVDYEIRDMQYQMKRVDMPANMADADNAAANSESGLQVDLETVATRQVNLAQIQGPTSQLISIPNITRGLGVLSVPLDQNTQRGLEYRSLRGVPDNMTSYQYELGIKGLVPNRPVPVEKASLANPLVQTQWVNEQMKVMESLGLQVQNLNAIGMNYAVGRQFSRPGQYFNLMEAGDLNLKSQFDDAQTSPKLYCHFINHLRSINISKNGIEVMN